MSRVFIAIVGLALFPSAACVDNDNPTNPGPDTELWSSSSETDSGMGLDDVELRSEPDKYTALWLDALETQVWPALKRGDKEPRACISKICVNCSAYGPVGYCKISVPTGSCYGECSVWTGCSGSCIGKPW